MSCFSIKKAILCVSISSLLYTLGCSTVRIREGVFFPPHEKYTISIPGKGWEPIRVGKEDMALWHRQYHSMIAIISSEIENKEFSLEMLNRHLFLGMTGKKIISKEFVLVDNQSALHTILEGEMDSNKLKIDSYVIKVGDKVYDLVCWAPADSFDPVKDDFENMVRTFRFTKTNSLRAEVLREY
ncbi:MAG: hypothetical protein ACK41Q_02195 [Candidatus Brocadia sp.]